VKRYDRGVGWRLELLILGATVGGIALDGVFVDGWLFWAIGVPLFLLGLLTLQILSGRAIRRRSQP
jgi:hypothetical protein